MTATNGKEKYSLQVMGYVQDGPMTMMTTKGYLDDQLNLVPDDFFFEDPATLLGAAVFWKRENEDDTLIANVVDENGFNMPVPLPF